MKTKAIALLKKEIALTKTQENSMLVVLFAFLTFVGAMIRIHIPGTPVPVTLQTLVLFISMYFLSARQAGTAQALYIFVGMVGAPVFAAGITGALALAGPTAGYLSCFIVSGFLMAKAIENKKRNFITMLVVFTAGAFTVLSLGTIHLILIYKLPVEKAFLLGFAPFIAGELLKAVAAAGLYRIRK